LLAKAGRMVEFAVRGQQASRDLIRIRCERGAEITRVMGFPEETAQAIRGLDEHWDGRGRPDGLAGEVIPLLARICGLAQTVEVFLTERGPAAAEEASRRAAGAGSTRRWRRSCWPRPGCERTSYGRTRGGRSRAWSPTTAP
jgi:hypothetical protein